MAWAHAASDASDTEGSNTETSWSLERKPLRDRGLGHLLTRQGQPAGVRPVPGAPGDTWREAAAHPAATAHELRAPEWAGPHRDLGSRETHARSERPRGEAEFSAFNTPAHGLHTEI